MSNAVKVFFSYSHKDEALREELETHLIIMKRQKLIEPWHDRQITAGTEWENAIDDNLEVADIILLLVSANFLASDYIFDKEMTRAMERHETRQARVIPIILKPSDWNGAPFGKLQALPKNAKPVTTWQNQDEAFLNVAQGMYDEGIAEYYQVVRLSPNFSLEEFLFGEKVADIKPGVIDAPASSNWLEKVVSSISDEPAFLEALEYGRLLGDADILTD